MFSLIKFYFFYGKFLMRVFEEKCVFSLKHIFDKYFTINFFSDAISFNKSFSIKVFYNDHFPYLFIISCVCVSIKNLTSNLMMIKMCECMWVKVGKFFCFMALKHFE